jgi:hypothetical protein
MTSAESEQPKQPEHVCGLQGFGRGAGSENDECPACRQPRPEQPQQPEKDHLAAPCGQAAPEMGAEMMPLETIEFWADAYSDPASGEHFMGHGMIVTLLREYAALRRSIAAQADAAPASVGQEPVAWMCGHNFRTEPPVEGFASYFTPLYTRPAPSTDALTQDEIAEVLGLLAPYHDGSDFEPECPGCTAYRKLSALTRAKEVQP